MLHLITSISFPSIFCSFKYGSSFSRVFFRSMKRITHETSTALTLFKAPISHVPVIIPGEAVKSLPAIPSGHFPSTLDSSSSSFSSPLNYAQRFDTLEKKLMKVAHQISHSMSDVDAHLGKPYVLHSWFTVGFPINAGALVPYYRPSIIIPFDRVSSAFPLFSPPFPETNTSLISSSSSVNSFSSSLSSSSLCSSDSPHWNIALHYQQIISLKNTLAHNSTPLKKTLGYISSSLSSSSKSSNSESSSSGSSNSESANSSLSLSSSNSFSSSSLQVTASDSGSVSVVSNFASWPLIDSVLKRLLFSQQDTKPLLLSSLKLSNFSLEQKLSLLYNNLEKSHFTEVLLQGSLEDLAIFITSEDLKALSFFEQKALAYRILSLPLDVRISLKQLLFNAKFSEFLPQLTGCIIDVLVTLTQIDGEVSFMVKRALAGFCDAGTGGSFPMVPSSFFNALDTVIQTFTTETKLSIWSFILPFSQKTKISQNLTPDAFFIKIIFPHLTTECLLLYACWIDYYKPFPQTAENSLYIESTLIKKEGTYPYPFLVVLDLMYRVHAEFTGRVIDIDSYSFIDDLFLQPLSNSEVKTISFFQIKEFYTVSMEPLIVAFLKHMEMEMEMESTNLPTNE